jgi:hypothetical protein
MGGTSRERRRLYQMRPATFRRVMPPCFGLTTFADPAQSKPCGVVAIRVPGVRYQGSSPFYNAFLLTALKGRSSTGSWRANAKIIMCLKTTERDTRFREIAKKILERTAKAYRTPMCDGDQLTLVEERPFRAAKRSFKMMRFSAGGNERRSAGNSHILCDVCSEQTHCHL